MTSLATKAFVLGSAVVDTTVCLSSLPTDGETVMANSLHICPGGKGLNQSIACSRLGVEPIFISRVGLDVSGEQILAFCRREAIETSTIESSSNYPTGVGVPMIGAAGEKAIVVFPGATLHTSAASVKFAFAKNPQVKFGLAQLETSAEALQEFFAQIRKRNGFVVLNAAPKLEGRTEFIGQADVLIANAEEATWLSRITVIDVDSAGRAASSIANSYNLKRVIVTLGANGAVALGDHTPLWIPARKVRVVDRTGAGDAFCGAFLTAIMRQATFAEACNEATVYASIACESKGACESMVTLDVLASRLAESRES